MPVNIIDVSTFTDPVTAPAGGDVRNAASVVDPAQKLANRTRWLRDRLNTYIPESGGSQDEFVYPNPAVKLREVFYPVTGNSELIRSKWTDDGTHIAKPLPSPTGDAADGSIVMRPPTGAVITDARLLVNRSTNRAGANRWQFLDLIRVRVSVTGTPSVASVSWVAGAVNDGGGTGLAFVTQSFTPTVIAAGDYLVAQVRGPTGTIGVGDELYGCRLTFQDPGPRNF